MSGLRIAQIATLATPVRRHDTASIEGVVWVLAQELERLGHCVTVFGLEGSDHRGGVVETLPASYGAPDAPDAWMLCEWINIAAAVERAERFDVIHAHNYLWSLPLDRVAASPMLHTTHVMPWKDEALLRRRFPDAWVSAISAFQWAAWPDLPPVPIVHHGVDPRQFRSVAPAGEYIAYLGRMMPEKGPLEAITAARRLGVPIRLAGPESEYLQNVVRPFVDGRNVEYVGWVGGPERADFLASARALAYPVLAPEPFGLVMIEAMMCGTPVAAHGVGAVAEIVESGVTGWTVAPSGDHLAGALSACFDLDRAAVRRRAEERFSAERMARQYANLYSELIMARRTAGRASVG
jgi:glycosyltransferase involved in cell wall biosynthesis